MVIFDFDLTLVDTRPVEPVLGHHQIAKPKPDPDGLFKAMAMANASPEDTFHIGDKLEDTEASKAAKVISIGAAWGSMDPRLLAASEPDYLFDTVADLRRFFAG